MDMEYVRELGPPCRKEPASLQGARTRPDRVVPTPSSPDLLGREVERPRPASRSTTGFAARPGTAVEPMCSTARAASARCTSAASRTPSSAHAGSDRPTRPAHPDGIVARPPPPAHPPHSRGSRAARAGRPGRIAVDDGHRPARVERLGRAALRPDRPRATSRPPGAARLLAPGRTPAPSPPPGASPRTARSPA